MVNKNIETPEFVTADKLESKFVTALTCVMMAIGMLGLVLVTVYINYHGS